MAHADTESLPAEEGIDLLLYEKTRHLCGNSGLGAIVNICIAVIFFFSISEARLDCFLPILLASLFRCGVFIWGRSETRDTKSLEARYKVALSSIALQGTAWGAATVVSYDSLTAGQLYFLATILAGMTAGAVGTLSSSFTAFSAFVVPATFPLLSLAILESSGLFRYIGIMGLVYVFALHVVARRISLTIEDQIVTRQKLEKANKQLSTYKDELEEVVSKRTKSLRLSEERYRDSFEKAVVGMAVLGLDGEFIRTNPAFQEMLGYSQDELSHKTFSEVTAMEDRVLWNEKFQGALAGGAADIVIEKRLLKKSGEIAVALVSFRIVRDEYGMPLHSIAQIQDITESKRIEREQQLLNEKVRQKQKMEAVGILAGGIAHDFNNILAAIIGYAELTKKRLSAQPKEEKSLSQILKAAERGKQLVQQILIFSRKGEEKQEPLKIASVVKDALNLIRQTIPTTTSIDIDIDPAAGTVLGDPTQLHQVIMNLCTNAYHAVRDTGGKIEVHLAAVEIDRQTQINNTDLAPGRYARLTIRDSGDGMSATTKERMFEPFFTTKNKGEGTGMGLAVVYGIIQRHRGTLEVISEIGEGTSVSVFFPLLSEELALEQAADGELQCGEERILLVDDEAMLADVGQLTLEALGYRVTSTTSAHQALEIFKSHAGDYDLVITDQSMPEMSGAKLAQEMLRISPDLPVILCTGYSESINGDRALALGIKAFLLKPINQSTLAKTIREVLDNNSINIPPSSANR